MPKANKIAIRNFKAGVGTDPQLAGSTGPFESPLGLISMGPSAEQIRSQLLGQGYINSLAISMGQLFSCLPWRGAPLHPLRYIYGIEM